jgi:hypothetical protein
MAWRAQLSDRPIRRLAILSAKPGVLAAWTQPDRVVYLDLSSGARVSDAAFLPLSEPPKAPRSPAKAKTAAESQSETDTVPLLPVEVSEDTQPTVLDLPAAESRPNAPAEPWRPAIQALWAAMRAPNGELLPYARYESRVVHAAADGSTRLYRLSPSEWVFEADGETRLLELEASVRFVAVAFDRMQGITAALDSSGRVHVYRRALRVGVFPTPLTLQDDLQPEITIADGGAVIAVGDGQRIALVGVDGTIYKTLNLHYALGALALSPDGKALVTGDLDAGVIRVYGGKDWAPTHQRFAVDLLADARRAQLVGAGTTSGAALGPIAVGAKGALAFAIAGTVCATSIARMKPPQPKLDDRAPKVVKNG